MRKRIQFKVNVQEFVQRSNAECERKRIVFTDAIQSIIKEKNVSYIEAKEVLKVKLRIDCMRREMQLINQ